MPAPDPTRLRKLERLARGGPPRTVDLFSGCGGISLGFKRAGYDIIANVEVDAIAAATHANNFHREASDERKRLFAKPRDITALEPGELLGELYPGLRSDSLVDIIVGGPPCQAFARIGRAKLREIWDHPEGFMIDPRSNLYLRYLHYVARLKPLAIFMENVPDVLNHGGHNIPEEMAQTLEAMGYVCRYTLLNGVHYGVPELRERLFFIAIASEVGSRPEFPAATHWYPVPQGYESLRRVALKNLPKDSKVTHWVEPPIVHPGLAPHVSAEAALRDLPPITRHLTEQLKKGPQRFDKLAAYRRGRPGHYAREMRNWPGFESSDGVYDHVTRLLPRDYRIFAAMSPGDEYPAAYRIANAFFQEALAEVVASGEVIETSSEQYLQLKAKYVPPYAVEKFPNKWRKMEASQPSRTLMAHLGKDGYSHIHYDSAQARTITVREAARLQSFPDGFVFSGAMNAAFRQIGNAVPPLLSWRIAEQLLESLRIGITWRGDVVGG